METETESRARRATNSAIFLSGIIGFGAAVMALGTASGQLGQRGDTQLYTAIAVIAALVFAGNVAARRFLLPRN